MTARYLIRFDDICPTMNWRTWDRIEPVLRAYGVKPILAVVPDNQDSKLRVDEGRADFWTRVRAWQEAGWCIALHGFQHRYVTRNAGLMGINSYSEFAGLSEAEQREKLVQALAIFRENEVYADVWVAPAHSFDAITVSLLLEMGIKVISDGFYARPVRRMGALWLPQQLWKFRPMPAGLWTVCLHCNGYGEARILSLQEQIARYASRLTSVDEVLNSYPVKPVSWWDMGFSAALRTMRGFKRWAQP